MVKTRQLMEFGAKIGHKGFRETLILKNVPAKLKNPKEPHISD